MISWARQTFRRAAGAVNSAVLSWRQAAIGGVPLSGGGDFAVPFTDQSALGVCSFWAAVKLIADLSSSLPLEVQERVAGSDRWAAVVDHDLEYLLNLEPNAEQTGCVFHDMRYTHFLTHGQSLSMIQFDQRNGAPAALWAVPPSSFTIHQDQERGRLYTVQTMDGSRVFDRSEVIHLMGKTLDGVNPLSPLRLFAQNLRLANGTRSQAAAFYSRVARPGVIVTSPTTLNPEQYAKLKLQLDSAYNGMNAGAGMLLENGLKTEQYNPMTFADYQLLELLSQNDKDIGEKIFLLPPAELKGWERASHLEKYVLGPLLLRDAQILSRQLPFTWDRRKIRIRHNLDRLVEMDIKTRYESYRVGIMAGFLRINEVRAALNREPDPDGDKLYLPQSVFGKPGTVPVVNPMKGPADAKRSTIDAGFHGVLTDVMSGLISREAHAAERLSKKPLEWRAAVERWYAEHETTVRDRLRHMPEERRRMVFASVDDHRNQLLALEGAPDLAAQALSAVRGWSDDAADLALTLLES